jgi:hypothetical protein
MPMCAVTALCLTFACNTNHALPPAIDALAQPTADGRQPGATVRASGIGYPPRHMRGPQARLMARRAAEVVAVRNLTRTLGHGWSARVRGFRYVSTTYRPDGSVLVVVETRP